MARLAETQFGRVHAVACTDDLLTVDADAVVISANNLLNGQSGWAKTIAQRAGPAYAQACGNLVAATHDLPQGSAWLLGSFSVGGASQNSARTIIQAITIGYRDDLRVRANGEVIYHAMRSALAVAAAAGKQTVAVYPMATRPDYGSERDTALVDALLRAIVDHGDPRPNNPNTVGTVLICEKPIDRDRVKLLRESFYRAESLWTAHPHDWEGCRHQLPALYGAFAVAHEQSWPEAHRREERRLTEQDLIPDIVDSLLKAEIDRLSVLRHQLDRIGSKDAVAIISQQIESCEEKRQRLGGIRSRTTEAMVSLCGHC